MVSDSWCQFMPRRCGFGIVIISKVCQWAQLRGLILGSQRRGTEIVTICKVISMSERCGLGFRVSPSWF